MTNISLKSRRIPSEYTELEYLESSGGQYIDTGVIPDNTTGFKVKMSVTDTATDIFRFGCRQDSGNTRFIIGTMTNKAYMGFGNTMQGSGWVITPNVPFEAKLNYYNDREGYINDNISATSPIMDLSSITFTYPLIMFGRNSAGSISSSAQRVYGCEITKGSDAVANYIPAKRKSDNVLGMFDTVNQIFKINAGTGTFTAGPVITTVDALEIKRLPSEYIELDYIQSTGTQFINTGINAQLVTRFKVKGYCTSNGGSNAQLIGGTSQSASTFYGARIVGDAKNWYAMNASNVPLVPSDVWATTDVTINSITSQTGTIINESTGTSYNVAKLSSGSWAFPNEDLRIFGGETTRRSPDAKIKSLDLYTSAGLVRQMVSARRVSDGVVGMYDLFTGHFYTNDGADTLIGGPNSSKDVKMIKINNQTIWEKYVPTYPPNVTFHAVDSRTGNAVTLTSVKVNGNSVAFTQSDSSVTISTPTSDVFTLTLSATNYNDAEGSYSYPTLTGTNINLTAQQQTGSMEISITWDHSSSETNRDIDSYLYIYGDSTKATQPINHIFHGNKTSSDATTSITLDKDDTGRESGENITIIPVNPNYFYHFYLYDYTGGSSTLPTNFANWHCNVKVTYNNVVVQNVTASASAAGKYWDVMNIENGIVSMINTFSDNITP